MKYAGLVALGAATLALTLSVAPARAELTAQALEEILLREQARTLEDGFLVETTRSEDPAIRARGFEALGKIGDREALPTLLTGLKDDDETVQIAAIFATGQLGSTDAVDALMALSKGGGSVAVRSAAVIALGKTGTVDAVPFLADLLQDGPEDTQPSAALAVGHMARRGVDITEANQAVNRALRSANPELTWRAAYAAHRGRLEGTTNGLQRSLRSADPITRIYATRAVGALNREKLARDLLPLLDDEDWRVRVEAVRSLAAADVDFFVSRVSLLLDDPNEHVLLATVDALGRMGPEGLARLTDAGSSSDWRVRAAYLRTLPFAQGEGSLIELRDAKLDPDWRIRLAAAETFADLKTEQAILVLEDMVQDEMPAVAAGAVNSLVVFPQLEATNMIRPLIRHEDWAVAVSAANGAGQRLDRSAVPVLIQAYQPLQSPVDTELMVAILTALGQTLPAKDEDGGVGSYEEDDFDQAVALLEAAMTDADPQVAERAAVSLSLALGEDIPIPQAPSQVPAEFDAAFAAALGTSEAPLARIVTNKGEIVIRLDPMVAPGTVANFITLARDGFYNGLGFHRVVSDFVVQGGDPRGDGWGGPGYAIRSEDNMRPFGTGAVGMATSGKDTGGCQFFITHSPQPHLDGRYTVFGQVVEGMDVVNRILVGDTIREIHLEGL